MTALGIFLLISLNIQFFIFLTVAMNSDNTWREKKEDDFNKGLIKLISSIDDKIKTNSDAYMKEIQYNKHRFGEIDQKLRGVNKIYNLLLIKEEEEYCKIQDEELGFSEILKRGDREEIEKTAKMLMGRWESRKRQIER